MKIHSKCTAELIDSMGDDLRVVNAARVSFGKWKDVLDEKDKRLIGYLARNQHWTPFSQVMITARIQAPIFVARQWFKSSVGVTINEESRRYVDAPPEFYIPDEFHARPENGIKQGSGDEHSESVELQNMLRDECRYWSSQYKVLIERGVCPEEARMMLPQSMMTRWVQTGSLAYYARVCKQRLDPHAQKAIQQLARNVSDIVRLVAPVSWSALMENVDGI